jgi:hypothetical protein
MKHYSLCYLLVLLVCCPEYAVATQQNAIQNEPVEFLMESAKAYVDPFNEIEVNVVFNKGELKWRVPAFWAGGQRWRVRFAPPEVGTYNYRWECTDRSNKELNRKEGTFNVIKYNGKNPLLKHGNIKVSKNHRYFEHADGTPFFWLGDTWWKGLCKRLDWKGFQTLATDRIEKGFTVIQIVAGLYPDEPPFDKRGENEGGWCWEKNYARINPKYFEYMDRRIQHLVDSGLVPCIVGCWGYYMPWMGVEKMKKHWRNLVARYGAYPIVWCLAGEWTMPYYVHQEFPPGTVDQTKGWIELAQYVRDIDPYRHPKTLHEGASARKLVEDPYLMDFDMPQTGHNDWLAKNSVRLVSTLRATNPPKPVLVGEVIYEGLQQANYHPVQRHVFWSCLLNGACGHTYGADGIWQMNAPGKPHGPSPFGGTYSDIPWDEAMNLEGSTHVGIGKNLITRYEWWRFEPHQDWVDLTGSYAAGIPGEIRLIYIPRRFFEWSGPKIKKLEKDVTYRAFYFNPATAKEYDLGHLSKRTVGEEADTWQAPWVPMARDWVLVLEKVK